MQIMLFCCIHDGLHCHLNANYCVCYHPREDFILTFPQYSQFCVEADLREWKLNSDWYMQFSSTSRNQSIKCFRWLVSIFISLVCVPGMNGDNTDSQKLNKIISEIQALQEVVARFRQLRLDATEFACLKCIVTFKAGKGNIKIALLAHIHRLHSGLGSCFK